MTMRITISIVPFGREKDEYTIETINVSNLGTTDLREWEYVVEHNSYKNYDHTTPRVFHERSKGAIALAAKALEKLSGL